MGGRAVTGFSRDSSKVVLDMACRRAGLRADAAELLRLGENAIYRLREQPVVVRIARDADHMAAAAKEVAVAEWLGKHDVPAARTWPVDQPLDVDGHPVTFWHYIDGRRGGQGDVCALGEVLRRVHALPPPDAFVLLQEAALDRVRPRIERAPISRADRAFLLGLLDELSTAVAELRYPLDPSVIHGDAHVQNLMVTGDDVVLIDFERVSWGQPEWDLGVTATEHVTAGWWTDEQYAAFAESYGFDVTDWEGFDTVRRVHEIKMTTWLMQNVRESPEVAAEFERRMRTIRDGEDLAWRAF
ncbi:MAG: phosphotransferase family protein [Dehalococcoidia bacterium]